MTLDTLETFPSSSEHMGLAALSRASLVYALGGLAYKGVALVTIPLLARLLSPAELGLLDLGAVLASLVGLAAVLGTDQAVAFHEERDGSPTGVVWGSTVAIVLVAGAGFAVGGLVLHRPLSQVLTGSPANGSFVAAAALYGGVVAVSATALNAVRLRGTPRAYAIASFLLVTAEMSAAFVVAWLGLGGVDLMILGWATGAVVVLLPMLARYLPALERPRMATVRRLVGYGAPLLPAAIAWLVGDAWIRGVIAHELEPARLGEYGIAYRVASVLGLAVSGFGVAWYPYLYRSPAVEVVPRASQALRILLLMLASIGVAVTALSPEIIAVVAGPAYANAGEAVGPLVGGLIALGVFVLIAAVVGASGSTRRIALVAVVGAIAQIVASIPLVAAFGLIGGALASLAGYVAAAMLLLSTETGVLMDRHRGATAFAAMLALVGMVSASLLSESSLPVRAALVVTFGVVVMAATRWMDLGRRWPHLGT